MSAYLSPLREFITAVALRLTGAHAGYFHMTVCEETLQTTGPRPAR